MSEKLLKNISTFEKILILALFAIPIMASNYNTWIVLALTGIILLQKLLLKRRLNGMFLFFGIPFFIMLFSLLFHGEFNFKFLSRNLLFVAIPFIFFNKQTYLSKKDFKTMFWIFTVSCLLLMLYYLVDFTQKEGIESLFKSEYNVLLFRTYIYNIDTLAVHPTYLSIWMCVASFQLLASVMKKFNFISLLFYIVFLISIILLSSKLALFCFLLGSLVVLVYYRKFLFLSLLILLGALAIYQFKDSEASRRYKELYTEFKNGEMGQTETSSSTRYTVLKCSTQLVQDNFWWGVGFDEIYPRLDKCYRENSTFPFYDNDKFLTHNYYYFLILNGGILALVLFLLYYMKLTTMAWNRKDLCFILFLGTIFTVNLTEDFLFRHHGIAFFSLFLMYYLLRDNRPVFLGNFLGAKNKKE